MLQGIAFPDFNDDDKLGKGKEMVDRLSNLVAIFNNPALDFRGNRAEGDDLLGDAYEYLMRHFATESGKSKGQFYTPAEVSRVMSMVIDLGAAMRADQSIYDPTCGSGSLLLKAHDEAKSRTRLDLALYGQEMDNATAALAKMNMVLHDCPTAEIWKDNSLAAPYFKQADGRLKTFDFVVANFPFSNKAWSNGLDPAHDLYGRFVYGIPPAKNGDYAFLLHILSSLKSTGKGAVIHPHGVLFRGGAEADIRKRLVRQGYIKGIIGLPANLFYGTGIPACILVLDKENAGARKGIFMIDASKAYIKDGNKNRLRAQDIHKIVDAFTRQVEIARYSRMVPLAEISDPKNDFNLNLPRYIDSTEPEDLQDIDGHLRGGIPDRDIDALDPYWQVFPAVRALLFESAGRPGYSRLKLPVAEIKNAIFGHPEFTAFNAAVTAIFAEWKAANAPRLHAIAQGDHPKALIETLSENLLETFRQVGTTGLESSRHTGMECRYPVDRDVTSSVVPSVWVPAIPAGTTSKDLHSTAFGSSLLDAYDVYQHLMDYWAATMQDDVYLIAHAGWVEAAKPRLIVETKEQKSKEQPDFTVGKQKFKSDLIPATLLVARYFAAEQAAIEALEAELGGLEQKLDELKAEHAGEGGLLEEVVDDKGKITKASLKARITEIKHIAVRPANSTVIPAKAGIQSDQEELDALNQCLRLLDSESETNRKVKAAQDALEAKVAAKYGKLTEAEIKTLVVDGKWLAQLAADVQSELDRVSQALTGRVRELADRYATPLPQLAEDVETRAACVNEHLKKMGFVVHG
ncbi:MAG: N-6 DNA methylase [Pseudomonadota bacterium]|nr:N-6 DNA methylase [Pseudomonadota bacterium]